MGLRVIINYEEDIDKLINSYTEFRFFKNFNIIESDTIRWNKSGSVSYDIQAMFIGKTGYGKSSTLNAIVGQNVFNTDDVCSCTKELYSAEYLINSQRQYYFSLCDMPGIGESNDMDSQYYEWYRDMLKKAHCVVYVLRADQRDFSLDKSLFEYMFKDTNERKKVVVGLNFADKVEPINRNDNLNLSFQQLENINKKMIDVSKILNIDKNKIIPYSASTKYNLTLLVSNIAKIIKSNQ